MIPRRFEWIIQSDEQAFAVVLDGGGLSVHEAVGAHDISTEYFANALVSETDAEDRGVVSEFTNHVATDAGFFRGAGTGGNTDPFGIHVSYFFQRDLIVSMDLHFRAQFSEKLNEVVGERIVIVDDQQHSDEFRPETIAQNRFGQLVQAN